MRKVRNIASALEAGYAGIQFKYGIEENKKLRFYGYWREQEHQLRVGEDHPECQQHPEYSPGGAHRRDIFYSKEILRVHGSLRQMLDFKISDGGMNRSSSQSAEEIEK